MEVIAHRGASGYAKENTLEAFEKAIEIGSNMVEFDVRKTSDRQLVLFHDPTVENEEIAKMPYEKLSQICQKQGFHVPTLEEALKVLRGKTKLDVELKEEGYEGDVMELVLKYFNKKDIIVISFNKNTVTYIKESFPDIKVGWVLGNESPKNPFKLIKMRLKEVFPFFTVKKLKPDFIDVHWKLALIPFYMKILETMGFPTILWPLDSPKIAKWLIRHKNIIGITTNYPDRIINVLKNE